MFGGRLGDSTFSGILIWHAFHTRDRSRTIEMADADEQNDRQTSTVEFTITGV